MKKRAISLLIMFALSLAFASEGHANITATDDFNRSNGAVGSNWTVLSGSFNVSSNQVVAGTVGGGTANMAIWNAVSFTADQIGVLTITHNGGLGVYGGTPQSALGICLRCSSGNGMLFTANDAGAYQWSKFVSGTGYFLGQAVRTPAAGDVIEARAVGTTYTLFVKSAAGVQTQLASFTDTDLTSGSVGLYASVGDMSLLSDVIGDDFKAGVLPIAASQQIVTKSSTAVQGLPFNVNLALTDGNGIVATAVANTAFALSVTTGTGSLSGTTTGTILAGNSKGTITGAVYSKIENGVVLTSTRTSGDSVSAANTTAFNVVTRDVTTVRDDFSGGLGANWTIPAGQCTTPNVTGGTFSPNPANGNNCGYFAVYSGQQFHDDQYAQATLAAIAPYRTVLHITAAAQSGSNTIYTYTLTSGDPVFDTEVFVIGGMANSGNNSPGGGYLSVLSHTSTTFTVANASGVTASMQSGTASAPSDSNILLMVRASLDGQTTYWCYDGTNSFVDGRVYDMEIWKMISGVPMGINATSALASFYPDSVGNVIRCTVVGDEISLIKFPTEADAAQNTNGKLQLSATDDDITGGQPGIGAWSVNGSGEYDWPSWGTFPGAPGNDGQKGTDFVAGDYPVVALQLIKRQIASDNFNRANASSLGANWTASYAPGGAGSFGISSNQVYPACAFPYQCVSYYNATSLPRDQWSQVTTISIPSPPPYQGLGPAVRADNNGDAYYVFPDALDGNYQLRAATHDAWGFTRDRLLAGVAIPPTAGDVGELRVLHSQLVFILNGTVQAVAIDTELTDGQPGIAGLSQDLSGANDSAHVVLGDTWLGGGFYNKVRHSVAAQ